MGLHSQLNDASSDSIPLLVVALIAASVNHLRSLLLWLFVSMGLPIFQSHDGVLDDVPLGSGLADLIVLSEQLNVNRDLSYKYSSQEDGSGAPSVCPSDCVVCLCRLRRGQQVRRLDCRHVFHKKCFDGLLDHFNFNCPLCRSPLVSEGRRVVERRRVSGDLFGWFGVR
ncbi:hypothetical protein Nepgr_022150 [Nepenthes gracilis]|uniref:RING-type domain-containing protein n=1 Tax=Nepenthes gracilis TaxID=150966 RepID=A0AAD3XXS3_NEPGR|nr:hypothetical protein Nepgr_022150 [Nepenthes gracilis]